MGFFSKLFKGPEIDMEKSDANAKKMRALFHQAHCMSMCLRRRNWRHLQNFL